MSKEIDWSKAPEGATHWHPDGYGYASHWVKPGHFCTEGFEGDGWKHDRVPTDLSNCVPRPPAWLGEGLPPVGLKVEALIVNNGAAVPGNTEWCQIIMKYKSVDFCVFERENGEEFPLWNPQYSKFRPVRTAEQIAAEERKAAIAELIKDLQKVCGCGFTSHAEDLYDMGYRKCSE